MIKAHNNKYHYCSRQIHKKLYLNIVNSETKVKKLIRLCYSIHIATAEYIRIGLGFYL